MGDARPVSQWASMAASLVGWALCEDLGVHVALGDLEEREHQGPDRGDAEGLLEEGRLVLAEQVPGRDAQHEETRRHVGAAQGVDELEDRERWVITAKKSVSSARPLRSTKPTGCCIQALATRIQKADRFEAMATSQIVAGGPCGTACPSRRATPR